MSAELQGARATAEAQQLPHEVLTGQQAMQRFPGIYMPGGAVFCHLGRFVTFAQ